MIRYTNASSKYVRCTDPPAVTRLTVYRGIEVCNLGARDGDSGSGLLAPKPCRGDDGGSPRGAPRWGRYY